MDALYIYIGFLGYGSRLLRGGDTFAGRSLGGNGPTSHVMYDLVAFFQALHLSHLLGKPPELHLGSCDRIQSRVEHWEGCRCCLFVT